ncbi:MAG: DinB family protein [Vicinamibacterales bacterium]
MPRGSAKSAKQPAVAKRPRGRPLEVGAELLEGFDRACSATELLVGAVPAHAWLAPPPDNHGRTIAGIVAHMQSIRRTFAKMGGATDLTPLDRLKSTPADAVRALQESHAALLQQFGSALENNRARVPGMPRRTIDMLLYLVQHDAHHRGQITRQLGALGVPLAADHVMRIWGWKKSA